MHPDFIHLFGHSIKWYGVLTAGGFLAAVYHWNALARRQGRDPYLGSELGVWTIICGILGARIAYVLSDWQHFREHPLEIPQIWQGGQIYYGGFILACIGIYVLTRIKKEPFLSFADFAITGLPLGHAIGRVGCFLNGCCYGIESNLPWACTFGDTRVHPTQLYEALANLLIYALLLAFYPKRSRDGRVLALYMLLYPVSRFLVEFLRGDPRQHFGPFTVAQVISIAIFVAGALLWFMLPDRKAAIPQYEQRPGTA